MHVTMVKKRLASGEACKKCVQAEELLKSRGLWDRVDEVVWADESDPSSPGMQLAGRFGIEVAPFFIVKRGADEVVYDSVLRFIKEGLDAPGKGDSAPNAGGAGASANGATAIDVATVARELAGKHPAEILRWGLARFGARLAIAFSGAEDVVLVHMASESGLPFSVFCLDTGRLHPETYRFIDTVRKRYKLEIALISPQAAPLEAFVRQKGLFSFYDDGHGECCAIRKIEPLRRTLATFAGWATGQRRDQSPATRSAIAVVERDETFPGKDGPGTLVKLNPLAAWTSGETWGYIREHSIPYNPLHERGYVSIGCEPCTRAILPGEHERAGRWWWEESTKRECGLHIGNIVAPSKGADR
jgi:phosphoadenosine phosphosulfate reductase